MAQIQPQQIIVNQLSTNEEMIVNQFPDVPIMLKVAACESGSRQFKKDGTVVKNKETEDYGILQISYQHIEEAKALGYDIFTLEGNIDYARVLYNRSGLSPWLSSLSCWGSSGGGTPIGNGAINAIEGENVETKQTA